VQLTKNGGGAWTDLTDGIASVGGPKTTFVSTVVASNHEPARAYVSKNGNKLDDFRPYVYTTDDFGVTWRSIAGNLPNETIHIVWEDNRNPNLLFAGTGGGVFVTINRGKKWVKLNNNIPSVPVLDLAVHPRERDLIVAALGRNVYVTNIAPLQELTDAVLAKDVHMFSIKPAVQRVIWAFGANDRLFSQRYLITPNEDIGMPIRYYLKTARTDGAMVVISDIHGKEVARLKGESAAGINTVYWNMLAPPAPGATGRGGGRGRGPGYSPELWAPLGDYVVTLDVGGQKLTQGARIVKTQGWTVGASPQVIR
jgi:hypothetical protein